jgi:DNA invertase Pin-like site-specific DNA recombinase
MKTRSRIRGSVRAQPAPRSLTSALGYVGASPATDIEQACRALGLRLVEVVRDDDGDSAERPALHSALVRVESGEFSCLVVGGLEQLSQSVDELASVIDRLERAGARLVVLDVGLDSASSTGRLALERRPVARAGQSVYAVDPVPEQAPPPPSEQRAVTPEALALRALGYDMPTVGAHGEQEPAEARLESLERRCGDLGLDLVEIIREGEVEGKALERPALSTLFQRIADGDAGCLVVGSLGQLSHSVAELGTIVSWLERNAIRLVTVDLELDSATPSGRLTTRALASVAGWEHDRLSERTRKGLAGAQARRRAAGEQSAAGGSSHDWPEVSKRIAVMRQGGMTLQAIADVLNAEGVPTPRGGAEWRPSSVQTAAGYRRRSRAKQSGEMPTVQRPPDSSHS